MIEEAVIELCRTLSSWLDLGWWYDEKALKYLAIDSSKLIEPKNRVRPRLFDQVGHQTTYASIVDRHFFTISCHCQTYQNYEQSRQKLGTFLEKKYFKNQSF